MLLLSTIFFGAITFALCYLHWFQTRSHFAKLINQFPQLPNKVPFFGHVWQFSTNPATLFLQARRLLASCSESIIGWSAYIATLHIVTADDAEKILSSLKNNEKSMFYTFLEPWLGTSLLASSGEKWRHRRKMLTPAFHFNILRSFVGIFGEHSANLVRQLEDETRKNNIINVVPIITKTTLTAICETTMGTKLNAENKTQNDYIGALHKAATCIVHRCLKPHLYTNFMFNLSPSGWSFNKTIKILHKFTNGVIAEREKTFKDSDVEDAFNVNEDEGMKQKRLAMLDLLISAKKNRNEIDQEGIREEVDLFMFAAHDTTTIAISLALMELAKHPNIQQKIIDELDEIFDEDARPASYEDLQNMKYLELCLKECLRLYPSAPIISRVLTEDTQLTHHVAPAGTIVFVHIYNVHRDPKHFPDSEIFDPNRFLPENSKGRHPYAYIPFSAGHRNCIGQKYAMLQLKSIVSSVFRNFTLESISTERNVKWIIDFVLRVDGPINVKFVPRRSSMISLSN